MLRNFLRRRKQETCINVRKDVSFHFHAINKRSSWQSETKRKSKRNLTVQINWCIVGIILRAETFADKRRSFIFYYNARWLSILAKRFCLLHDHRLFLRNKLHENLLLFLQERKKKTEKSFKSKVKSADALFFLFTFNIFSSYFQYQDHGHGGDGEFNCVRKNDRGSKNHARKFRSERTNIGCCWSCVSALFRWLFDFCWVQNAELSEAYAGIIYRVNMLQYIFRTPASFDFGLTVNHKIIHIKFTRLIQPNWKPVWLILQFKIT